MSNQIQMIIQQRCGELEKELLGYLQRSMFDPKRRKTNALPNYLVLTLLLSTYNFLGVQSWNSDFEKTKIIVDCLTSHYKNMYQGYDFRAELATFQSTLEYQPWLVDCALCSFPELLENLVLMFEAAGIGYLFRYSARPVDTSQPFGSRVDLKVEGWNLSCFTAWYADCVRQCERNRAQCGSLVTTD
ncbi:MAG: hypothetical protein M1830_005906 [Pleopsidium flavum]|nr:MAG: hypothetical protein M1830_005906 [Pleopsidium flavum]